jgi:large subunit ribosomal protein L19
MNIASLTESKPNSNIPTLAPGDKVKVSAKVVEGDKERLQVFQGVVIRVRRSADGGSFTVRRVSRGIGVERTFLFQSPMVAKVEVVQHGKVRRAKLYYLRQRSGKAARLRERRVDKVEPKETPEESLDQSQLPE